ncbi:MAG: GatB/YqeY domain-containing protein, partial [Candidatus Marinimicrobia bacterium]|nr:GatB/YqeY domain-containing protein [Candidatus Neomarinimicrobiota bacterium]
TLVKQRKESVEMFEKGGREELASAEKVEIEIINKYLPQMMPDDKIRDIVKEVVEEVGATSMADMGKIMPEVMKQGKGLIDGKTAQQFVREILG